MIIKKICKHCKKVFEIPHWRKKAMYCNNQCRNNDREKYWLKCSYCNKEIKIIGHRYKKSKYKLFFCSNKCKGQYFSKQKNPNYNNHKLKGKNNPNYKNGKWKKCLQCKKKIWVIPFKFKIKKFCSWKCKIKYERGKNASNWIDGKSNEPYPLKFNYYLKEKIRKRDNYQCQLCFKKGRNVHHIDYDKESCNEDNLIILCSKCHQKTNRNRKFWKNYFKEMKKNAFKFSRRAGLIHDKAGLKFQSPLLEIIRSKFGCIGETPINRAIPREVLNDPVETARQTSIKQKMIQSELYGNIQRLVEITNPSLN